MSSEHPGSTPETVARLLVRCLENEGVEVVFGLPGEETIPLVDALADSPIRFVTVRDERGAAFMADTYGRLSGKAGVCLATLGPGAINLLLGVTNAQMDGHPLVAITAQAGLDRIFKESHQVVDLVRLFRPVTKWGEMLIAPATAPELVRKAFKQAQTERPGATAVIIPEDVGRLEAEEDPLPVNRPMDPAPSVGQVDRAARVLNQARRAVVLAGPGIWREGAGAALVRFAEALDLPVATTFLGKGVFPDDHPNALGTLGFIVHDYTNFDFDRADVVVAVGYDLVEYPPEQWNPKRDKQIIHIHRTVAEVDACYTLAVGLQGSIAGSLDAIARVADAPDWDRPPIRNLLQEELERGKDDEGFPLKPQRIVAEIRGAMGREDIVLCDTGALKMWMGRLYPCYAPETCLISNGLATMAFALPGALAAKIALPDRKVLATMGDGAFLMAAAELETAIREGLHIVVLVWVDGSYGLIRWKQELEVGRAEAVDFGNPDFVRFAESFGAKGYSVGSPAELGPILRAALDDEAVSVIACPVDYAENAKLVDALGNLAVPQ
jgi:acetolactate synthase I/II/III large subunit